MNFKKNFKRFFTLSRNAEGFTLVELIVVIAILGILAVVAVPTYTNYVESANKAVDKQNLSMMNSAFAVACVMNGVDPVTGISDVTLAGTGKTVTGADTVILVTVTRTASEGATDTADEIKNLFNQTLEGGLTFKTIEYTAIDFANGSFFAEGLGDGSTGGEGGSGNSGSTGVYGGIFDGLKDNETFQSSVTSLNNSTFGTIGAQGLMQKVDTVTGLAAGLCEMNDNFMASLAGALPSLQTKLGMNEGEFAEYLQKMISDKAAALNPEDPDAAYDQARYEIMANYAVLNAAQNTGSDKAVILNNLKGGVTVSDIKNMMDKNAEASTQQEGMANAAMMYAMYTAYANSLPADTAEQQKAKEDALSITGDISSFVTTMANQQSAQYTGFQSYLNQATGDGTSQAEKDLDGYLGALSIINQSSNDKNAVSDLLVNGYNNQELINALQGVMGTK